MRPPASSWKKRLKGDILAAKKIVILAVGNTSKGDDAAGLICANKLKKLMRGKGGGRLKIFLGYEVPENLTGKIRKLRPDLVLILDAAQGIHKPGAVFIVKKDEIRDNDVSTHRISLVQLINYLKGTVGCRVILLGIQPLNLSEGTVMSPRVERSAENLAGYLASIFDRRRVKKGIRR